MPVAGHDSKTATIAAAASLSDEVAVQGHLTLAFLMPAAWTAASITFQGAATSGGTFGDLYTDTGTEVEITVAASRLVVLTGPEADAVAAVPYLKLRSGTGALPVAQGAERLITVLLK